MPNHVRTVIAFDGKSEDIKAVMEAVKGENGAFDFNKLIPTPDYIYQGNLGLAEKKKYGCNNWYDWNCDNWGTKWNAYDIETDNYSISFSTAWSFAYPVMIALAELCDKYHVAFDGVWADEDMGNNSGQFDAEHGDFYYDYNESCSDEAYECYVSAWGESDCLGREDDGTWVHYSCKNCPHKCY